MVLVFVFVGKALKRLNVICWDGWCWGSTERAELCWCWGFREEDYVC